ncbi:reverse transcriptase [Caerostris extrusa]|uniref:Reverse transcriptase n=1 Tax=Caerostris extrusa TaxID=172846 RepID=A0AAV4MT02_CAEEX|nr:reverse transcriptase [Caerostris extrusa]
MIWNLDEDTLRSNLPLRIDLELIQTKITVLSLVQKIFDPLGLVMPCFDSCQYCKGLGRAKSLGIVLYPKIYKRSTTRVKAKARVAPIKDVLIPKLELMSCCTGTILAHSIRLAIDFPDMPITSEVDSMTAPWWIREHGEWSIFVSNRIKEIRKLTSPE